MTILDHPRAVDGPRGEEVPGWRAFVFVFGATPAIYALTAPRKFTDAAAPFFGVATPSRTATAIDLIFAAQIAVSLYVILRSMRGGTVRMSAPWLSVVAFFAAPMVGSIARAAAPSTPSVIAILVFTAAALMCRPRADRVGSAVVAVLVVYAVTSLLVVIVAPDWALQRDYGGRRWELPWAETRLHGTAAHATALGLMMVTLLVLEWVGRRRVVVLTLGFAVLLWTQSKTSWGALGVIAGVALLRYFRRDGGRSLAPVFGVVVLVFVSAQMTLGAATGPPSDKRDNSEETFTGRKAVWQATLDVWRDNRLLGYGTNLWDVAMYLEVRDQIGFRPANSHNQLMQSLGEGGFLGALALAGYLVVLLRLARRGEDASGGGSTAVLAVLVIHGTTQVPMAVSSVSAQFSLHVMSFWYLLAAAGEAEE